MPDLTKSAPRAPGSTTRAGTAAGSAGAVIAAAALSLAVAGLKPDEGKSNASYLDIAAIPTECYGHTGREVRLGTRKTDAQCEQLLADDARVAQLGVARAVPGLASRPYQWAAATRFAFNVGVAGFSGSTAARRMNAGDWRGGCDALLAWNKARVRGRLVVVPGLAARRQRERAQCLTGLPS